MGRFSVLQCRRGCAGWPRVTLLHGLVLADDALVQHVRPDAAAFRARPPSAWQPGCPSSGRRCWAISSSVTLSCSRVESCAPSRLGGLLSSAPAPFAAPAGGRISARRPCSGHIPARPGRSRALTCSISSRSCCTLPMACFLVFPAARFMALELVAHVGQLLLQLRKALLRKLVGLLFQRRLLDLHAA